MNRVAHASDGCFEGLDGVLVVGHGTRDAAGIAEFHETVRLVVERAAPLPVEAGFLELAEPTIAAAMHRLVERGARRVAVMPLLLFAAGHAKRDIPQAVAAAADELPGTVWLQSAPLGLHPRLIELSLLRYTELGAAAATDGPSQFDDADTLLLLVGRGSSDPEAIAAMHEFVRLRSAARPVGRVEVAFTDLSEPRLEATLPRVADAGYRRIVVQPHLLFSGELSDRVRRRTEENRRLRPDLEWRTTAPLGPHALLVEAIAGRIVEAAVAQKFILSKCLGELKSTESRPPS